MLPNVILLLDIRLLLILYLMLVHSNLLKQTLHFYWYVLNRIGLRVSRTFYICCSCM
jgi:hypothetical protein